MVVWVAISRLVVESDGKQPPEYRSHDGIWAPIGETKKPATGQGSSSSAMAFPSLVCPRSSHPSPCFLKRDMGSRKAAIGVRVLRVQTALPKRSSSGVQTAPVLLDFTLFFLPSPPPPPVGKPPASDGTRLGFAWHRNRDRRLRAANYNAGSRPDGPTLTCPRTWILVRVELQTDLGMTHTHTHTRARARSCSVP